MVTDIMETTMIARCASLLTAEMDGEIVMVNLEYGQYYGLDDISSDIWGRARAGVLVRGADRQPVGRLRGRRRETIAADVAGFTRAHGGAGGREDVVMAADAAGLRAAGCGPSDMIHAYRLATLRLVSDVELPELSPWSGEGDRPTDVVFRLGKPPPFLEAPDRVFAGFQTKGRRQYLTTYRDDARVMVEDGRTVTIELAPGADAAEASSTLMSPVQAVLWHQRGLLPLHASVIGVNGVAVALAGPSGVGKSTLAAALAAGGHEVLADDICIVDAANGADVLPGAARLRLWRDAVDHLNIAAQGMARDKYLVEGGTSIRPDRRKLAAIVLLSRQGGDAVEIEQLRGARCIMELREVVHMLPEANALGLAADVFAALTSLPSAGVATWRLVA